MNGKTIKKIRKEINSSLNDREKEIANQMMDYLDSLCLVERVKIAWKILRKKL